MKKRNDKRIKDFFNLLVNDGYLPKMSEVNESIFITIDDTYLIEENCPNHEIYFEFDEYMACYLTFYNLKEIDIENTNAYVDTLIQINDYNDSNDQLKWVLDEDGVVSAMYVHYMSFYEDADIEGLVAVFENTSNEIYEKMRDDFFQK